MTNEIDLRAARAEASKEADAALQKRESRIGNNRDAVRAFHVQILALRKAGLSWEQIAEALERWCGRKIPPNTVKAYTSKVNKGTLPPWPDDAAPLPAQIGDTGLVGAPAPAPVKPIHSVITRPLTSATSDPQSTIRTKPDPE